MKRLRLHFLKASIIMTVISCGRLYSADISVIPSTLLLEKFRTLTIQIDLALPFTNPFDPEDIRVDAVISTPSGRTLMLPCFYLEGTAKNSKWEARYTPMQTGQHTYHIQSISRSDTVVSKTFRLAVKESSDDGFLRLDGQSNYSFLFDSGKRFRGVGMNLGWEIETMWGHDEKYTYEMFLGTLEKNKANFIRTWMCPWNLPLEWTRVITYESLTDEYENWDKIFAHSPGLILQSGKTDFTEDDLNRVAVLSDSMETMIYRIKDVKRFKMKLFYQKEFSSENIKCEYSADNKTYHPVEIELSQTWNTNGDWQRIFVGSLSVLPPKTDYLKIEFRKNLQSTPQLANMIIEHGKSVKILDAPGLGKYDQKTAKRLDDLMRMAQEKGVYVMLTHDYHGLFKPKMDRWGGNDEWRRNPYNSANGGPCRSPEEFFTSAEAKRFYKNRLRYMVARWGYSTHLACWEFWNEIDNVMAWQNVSAEAIVSWHKEMADYLKQIDLYGHLVSTSVTNREIPGLWEIEQLDFTQHHNYGPTANMKESILQYVERFKKPDVVGEFALGWKGPGKDYPVELYEGEFHNGLWRGIFSPTPILPLTWWWEWHYAQNHYYHFRTAVDFVSILMKDRGSVLQDLPVKSENDRVEVMGLKSGDDLFIWLFNADKNSIDDLAVNIPGAGNSRFLLKTYDTWNGSFSDDIVQIAVGGRLILNDIRLKGERDAAVWLRSAEE